MGVIASFNGHFIKCDHVPARQMAWQGCLSPGSMHLYRLRFRRSTWTLACSLGIHKGLPERIKDTSLPGRGNSTVKGWEFHRAGVSAFLPKIHTVGRLHYRGEFLKQMAHWCFIHTKRIGTWHSELDVNWRPCLAIAEPISSSVKWE